MTNSNLETKLCRSCKETLHISRFYTNKWNKDKLSSYCKECTTIRAKAHAEMDAQDKKGKRLIQDKAFANKLYKEVESFRK